MSPPKVNLAGKEPLQTVSDEVPVEKTGDGLGFPAVITVDHPQCGPHRHHRRHPRRGRRVVCGVVMLVVVILAALATAAMVHRLRRHGHRHHHRKGWSCGNRNPEALSENVRVDHQNQLIYAEHDHDEKRQTVAMQILHEYGRGLVAYKDVDNTVCYIDRLDETFVDGYERWESYEKEGRPQRKALKVISKPIEVEVLKHVGDVHIYAHCENAKSVWVMEIRETEVTEEMNMVYV